MKRKEKLFGFPSFGSSRVPLHSNVYGAGGRGGYSAIGTNLGNRIFDMDRKSPLLGNATASNRLSSYYDKVAELRGYQLLDISKLATNFFADYVINFLADDSNGQQVITVLNEDGSTNDQVSKRLNDVLLKDIKIFDYIRDHVQDYVYYGGYYSMLGSTTDELGHTKFKIDELLDPIAVVAKKKREKDGTIKEVFIARGDDGNVYEIPADEVIYIASNNLRLVNDLSEDWREKEKRDRQTPKESKDKKGDNREKVLRKESYSMPKFHLQFT